VLVVRPQGEEAGPRRGGAGACGGGGHGGGGGGRRAERKKVGGERGFLSDRAMRGGVWGG
jgi:hypothetical protein